MTKPPKTTSAQRMAARRERLKSEGLTEYRIPEIIIPIEQREQMSKENLAELKWVIENWFKDKFKN